MPWHVRLQQCDDTNVYDADMPRHVPTKRDFKCIHFKGIAKLIFYNMAVLQPHLSSIRYRLTTLGVGDRWRSLRLTCLPLG